MKTKSAKKLLSILLAVILTATLLPLGAITAQAASAEVVVPQYYKVGDFHDGLAYVMDDDGNYGYVDKTGKLVIPMTLRCAYQAELWSIPELLDFKDGVAVAFRDEGYPRVADVDLPKLVTHRTLIDKNGKEVIPWDSVPITMTFFTDGVIQSTSTAFIDKSGKVVVDFAPTVAEVHEMILPADSNHREQKPSRVTWSTNYYNGLNQIKVHWRDFYSVETVYGVSYIDKSGKLAYPINPAYDLNISNEYGIASVRARGQQKYGLIDKAGRELAAPQYDDIGNFFAGMAPVKKDGKWGYIDTTGKIVIPLQYAGAMTFSEGLAYVTPPAHFIDVTGKTSLSAPASALYCVDGFRNSKAIMKSTGNGYFLIDLGGKIVKELPYDRIDAYSDGFYAAMTIETTGGPTYGNEYWGFIDSVGNDKFAPNDKLTRGQAAGVMDGVGNNTFAPKNPYTREQSIITILRLYNVL
jgi:hypothetical protein